MFAESSSPRDLADVVLTELRLRQLGKPKARHVAEICERVFFASLKTEELHRATISLTYIDPDNPDPDPPEVIHHDQWAFVRFAEPAPFDTRNLVKLSPACDPRSSSFAVYPTPHGELKIWGLIDQQIGRHDWINMESDSGPRSAGLFQLVTVGPGHITVYVGYENIAELKLDTLVSDKPDVFRRGPVLDKLSLGINDYLEAVRKAHTNEIEIYVPRLVSDWIAVLCRLLLRIQAYQHGGALLLTPDVEFQHLNVKHRIDYGRIREALVGVNMHGREAYDANELIWDTYVDELPEMPTELHLKAAIERERYEAARSELNGAIWFVSLLSRVDGLVLMDPYLNVRGFGTEIKASTDPVSVYLASKPAVSPQSLRKCDLSRFGTRHRSMIRYCDVVPGAVGFIVSQDGPVRVVTRVSEAVLIWEDLRLHQYETRKRSRARKRQGK